MRATWPVAPDELQEPGQHGRRPHQRHDGQLGRPRQPELAEEVQGKEGEQREDVWRGARERDCSCCCSRVRRARAPDLPRGHPAPDDHGRAGQAAVQALPEDTQGDGQAGPAAGQGDDQLVGRRGGHWAGADGAACPIADGAKGQR